MCETSLRLSIIIPVYNVEKHLSNCLDSVIDESVSNYEIILIDDGSTDNSSSICDEYARKYSQIKVIHNNNEGAAFARNVGLNIAKGDFITFLDSDDFVDESYISYILLLIDSVIYSDSEIITLSYFIDYNESDVSEMCQLSGFTNNSPEAAVRELESCGAFNLLWNKVYKKSLIQRENRVTFLKDTEPGEDLIFNVMCFIKAKKVSLINKPFYHWVRRGEDTLANRFREDLFERNMLFIDYRKKLYHSLGIEKTDIGLLSKGNLEYIFACVPNMYRKGKRFSRKKRMSFYTGILNSEEIREWSNNVDCINNRLLNQFIMIYRMNSAFILDSYYCCVMSFRNMFGKTWSRIRKRIKQ